jgi:hypothetical protein
MKETEQHANKAAYASLKFTATILQPFLQEWLLVAGFFLDDRTSMEHKPVTMAGFE